MHREDGLGKWARAPPPLANTLSLDLSMSLFIKNQIQIRDRDRFIDSDLEGEMRW